MSESQRAKAEELIDAFEIIDDWEERYAYLIDLGRALPPLPPEEHNDANLVRGCQSLVYVVAQAREGDNGLVLDLTADSNSAITKGIVAILCQIYSGETPSDILEYPIDDLMQSLGLDQHLSPGRRNGLAGMVARIKNLASHCLQPSLAST